MLTIDTRHADRGPAADGVGRGLTDANNSPGNPTGAITGPVAYFWQVEQRRCTGVFEDISWPPAAGDAAATGPTFTPGDDEVGLRLRVRAVYEDANGVLEEVFSTPTAAVANVNDALTNHRYWFDTRPDENAALDGLSLGRS